jgi:hypothetical protein
MFYYTLEELRQIDLKHLDSEQLLAMAQEMQQRLQQAQPAGDGWRRVDQQEPEEFQQVLVTDGEEFRVLHREQGSWAFTVSPCDRKRMVWWKDLK